LTKNFKNLNVGLLRFLGFFKKTEKTYRLFRSHFPTLHRTGLIRRRISPPEPGLIRRHIRPGASYTVRNDPPNGISALPQETYNDCYTSRVW